MDAEAIALAESGDQRDRPLAVVLKNGALAYGIARQNDGSENHRSCDLHLPNQLLDQGCTQLSPYRNKMCCLATRNVSS